MRERRRLGGFDPVPDIGFWNGLLQLFFADIGGFHLPETRRQHPCDLAVAGGAVPGAIEIVAQTKQKIKEL